MCKPEILKGEGIPETESSRCHGACCKRWVLCVSHEELGRRAALPGEDEARVIFDMAIPLGLSNVYADGTAEGEPREWFSCRHVLPTGDCGIYDSRPDMCRHYPYGRSCDHGDACGWTAARARMVDFDGNDKRRVIGLEGMAVAPATRWDGPKRFPGAIRWSNGDDDMRKQRKVRVT